MFRNILWKNTKSPFDSTKEMDIFFRDQVGAREDQYSNDWLDEREVQGSTRTPVSTQDNSFQCFSLDM